MEHVKQREAPMPKHLRIVEGAELEERWPRVRVVTLERGQRVANRMGRLCGRTVAAMGRPALVDVRLTNGTILRDLDTCAVQVVEAKQAAAA